MYKANDVDYHDHLFSSLKMKQIVPAPYSTYSWRIICTSQIKVMLAENGLRTVTKIQGFVFNPALIIYGIPMEKKNHARTHPKMLTAVTIIKILHWIILSLTHIHTNCDTHGFWACRHPSPPLHSLGQYPQPG